MKISSMQNCTNYYKTSTEKWYTLSERADVDFCRRVPGNCATAALCLPSHAYMSFRGNNINPECGAGRWEQASQSAPVIQQNGTTGCQEHGAWRSDCGVSVHNHIRSQSKRVSNCSVQIWTLTSGTWSMIRKSTTRSQKIHFSHALLSHARIRRHEIQPDFETHTGFVVRCEDQRRGVWDAAWDPDTKV